ncbi:MAG: hypothetical protein EDM79_13805 [Chloroflexi bacterium]|nr:MAG: hypothetical protein EDM79_13805 [Chloroflexota bacterium]
MLIAGMFGRKGADAFGVVANGAVGARSNRVRYRTGFAGAGYCGRLNHSADGRRIQADKLPLGGVAAAVGAKTAVISAARIANVVTLGAGLIELVTMAGQPVGIPVRVWLVGFVNADERSLLRFIIHNFRNGVADVTFQAHGLACGRGVLAIMAAEAAGKLFVSHVVGMGLPADPHIGKYCDRKNFLKGSHRLLDRFLMLGIKIRIVFLIPTL